MKPEALKTDRHIAFLLKGTKLDDKRNQEIIDFLLCVIEKALEAPYAKTLFEGRNKVTGQFKQENGEYLVKGINVFVGERNA